ncbi:MAG: tetratricopeptide repeat protein [Gammaproteobacteria bacterium]|nr:tetratricopeptide repeat protein [Gammaproteobacteria bacterium]
MTNTFTRKVSAGLLIVLLSACASAPQQQSGEPASDYRPDASYSMLMAEIALQRKAYLVTAQEYLNAAEQSADPEFAQRATEFAYEYNYDILALGGAQRWLELEPQNLLANEYAGRLYLRRNQLDRALAHWRASLGAGDLSRDEFLRIGADMAEEENPVGATYVLTRLVNERPDASGLRMALAYSALRAGAFDLSLVSAQQVELAEPDWIQPQLIIPKALLSMDREYEAFAYLDDALESRASTTLELEYVRLLSAVGRHEEAMRRLLELGKLYGAQPELVRMHGVITFAAGDLEAAEQDFEQLLFSGNHVYESYFTLGRIAMVRAEYRRAIGYFERIRGSAYLVRAQLSISVAEEALGNDEAALELLRSFAEDYPRYALDVVGSEAQLLFRMGRVDEALALYENAVKLRPDLPALMLEYGAMLDLAGRHKDAIDLMRRAAEIAPQDSNVLNTLGYTLTNRTKRHDEAYRLIRMALELDPDSAPIIDSMGWVLYRQGRLDEARSYLELALSRLEDPEIIAHLGEVLWVSDERERALATWDKGLIDYPDSQPLIETRQRFAP